MASSSGQDAVSESKIRRFQENLAPIRKIAGWKAEELGDRIGVTKQTISNLETGNSKMSPMQYLAIRRLLDEKMKDDPENVVLPKVLQLLLDSDEPLEGKDYEALKLSIAAVSTSAGIGIPAVVLGGMLIAALVSFGTVLPAIGMVAAGLPVYKYFREITGNGTKGGNENGETKN